MNRLALSALAFLAVHSSFPISAGDVAAQVENESATPKFGPTDIEVRLRDGSVVIGQLTNPAAFELKTSYGTLTFPIENLVTILPAVRFTKEKDEEIVSAIKNLDNDDFATRGRAQASLEELGVRAASLLREARGKSSAEARTRIDSVLKKIAAQNQKVAEDDTVRSNEFEAVGKLQLETLSVKNRIGEFKVKLGDIQSIQWLSHGCSKVVVLDCATALGDWIDSGLDTTPGEKLVATGTGTITLFNNFQAAPDGNSNVGNREGILIGSVIGKIGPNGGIFLIGSSKSWVAPARGRLYLKIHCPTDTLNNNSSNPSSGSFTVHVSSGVLTPDPAAIVGSRGL